jgi:hypothetical protein
MRTFWVLASILLAAAQLGCAARYPNRALVGERLPRVQGRSLAGTPHTFPDDLRGKKAIVVIGYVQRTQFDIDRWGVGFFTANLELPPVYELPTIVGLVPTLLGGTIDEGMRGGIPSESWKDVVTIYGGDARTLTEWTGNERPQNARVLLLDEEGVVRFAHDAGYGLPPLQRLVAALRAGG